MKIVQILLVSTLTAFAVLFADRFAFNSDEQKIKKETRLEQIMRTGTLRCGYSIWPPALIKDPNTGEMSGIFYELMQEVGKQLEFKIEWTTEISPPHMFDDMANNRYDMVCSPYVPTPARAKMGLFSAPIFYNALYLYVSNHDNRFEYSYEAANSPDIRFSATDGSVTAIVTAKKFPKASINGLPEYSTPADNFLQVINGKADATVSEPLTFGLFTKNNPGLMKKASDLPLQISGASMPMPANERGFKDAVDLTLQQLHNSGFIDAILKKYEPEGARLLRIRPQYENGG